ncbi:MAG TPA: DUF892 family protein, partial [Solirubrobacterales bacterium]|nr:DUF892 family protein [Solirubrobacterales bacterium]
MADPDQHERRARDEAETAACEAASIGGPGSEEDVPEAQRPVAEAGGGEAEGFERSQEEPVEAATQGDAAPDPAEEEEEAIVSSATIDEQLDKCLTDVHAIEEQALTQLRRAPDIAGDERLARVFERHLAETNAQEDRIRRRLSSRGADLSTIKDLAGKTGGVGMVAFAKANP